METPELENKIALILSDDLESWQELNVTAFLASAIASHFPETMGKDFVDASSVEYLGIFRIPVIVYRGTTEDVRKVYARARERDLHISIYTRKIFSTQGAANWDAVNEDTEEQHDLVGVIVYGKKSPVDKAFKSQKLHP